MNLAAVVLIVVGGLGGTVSAQNPEFAAGRAAFARAEFRRAAAHFQRALKADPTNAEAYYWAGIAYERMADLATPFGGRYDAKSREYLGKALNLAPDRAEYREALFDSLLDAAEGGSPGALRRAADIVLAMSESDPNYDELHRRLADAGKRRISANTLLSDLLLLAPRASYRIAALPASAVSNLWSSRSCAAAGE